MFQAKGQEDTDRGSMYPNPQTSIGPKSLEAQTLIELSINKIPLIANNSS